VLPVPDKLKRLVLNVPGPCAEFGVGHIFWESDLSSSVIIGGARLRWRYGGEAIIMSNIRVLDCLSNKGRESCEGIKILSMGNH